METDIVIWFQENASWLYVPMRAASELGPSTTFGILLAGLYWCWDYSIMCRVWMVNISAMWLTSILKLACHTPRPYWIEPSVQGLTRASGFGMPSGHALVATAVWSYLARKLNRYRVTAICAGIVFLVGFSRLYLGVHTLAQVLVGIGLGLSLMFVFPHIDKSVSGLAARWSLQRQLLVLSGGAVLACVVAVLVRSLMVDYEVPAAWTEMALSKRPQDGPINPSSIHSAVLSVSIGLGFLGGYLILVHLKLNHQAKSWRGRFWRAFIGVGVAGPYLLVTRRYLRGESMPELSLPAAIAVDTVYGVTTGVLISLIVPLIFNRARV